MAENKEWNYADSLNWDLLFNPNNKGIQTLLKDLNALYREQESLHLYDCDERGFEWIDGSDVTGSTMTFMRKGGNPKDNLIIACNFTPVPRYDYKIGVTETGVYEQLFNSDDLKYAGSGVGNYQNLQALEPGWNFKPYRLQVVLPPLSVVVFKLKEK